MNVYPLVTYSAIIRNYSATVASGHADTDLTPRQRRLAVVMLNIASNAGHAMNVAYPPTPENRVSVARYLSDKMWDAGGAICEATAPSARGDYTIALDRAIEALQGV